MNDDHAVLMAVRDSFAEVQMERPVESIVARGQARRRQRRFATLAVAVLTAGGLALGATVAGGAPARDPVHVHMAAFTVDTNPDGTVTVTISRAQYSDPVALREALSRAGVRAVVEVVQDCNNPLDPMLSPDDYRTGLDQLTKALRLETWGGPGVDAWIITPSAMPKGMEFRVTFATESRDPGYRIFVGLAPVGAVRKPPCPAPSK
jgi:hypothetical protein